MMCADYKETFEIGKDYDSVWPNMWPEKELPDFKPFCNSFFLTCHRLHVEILRALALAMGLGENFFDMMTDQMAHNLRM
jgi:isopenicillin N synthase-like dioxygenase